jgi:hypothetical protein
MTCTTKILQRIVVGVAVTGLAATAMAAPPDTRDMKDIPLTLAGCVVAGEAKDSYLLTNVVLEGTTAAPTDAFYRFNTTRGLKDHVGRRVEVVGKADLDDIDKGKIRVKVEDGKSTTEIGSERRTVKVEQDIWFGSTGAMKISADVPTYSFEVESVKRLEGNCANAGAAR